MTDLQLDSPFRDIRTDPEFWNWEYNWHRPIWVLTQEYNLGEMLKPSAHYDDSSKRLNPFKSAKILFNEKGWPLGENFAFEGVIPITEIIDPEEALACLYHLVHTRGFLQEIILNIFERRLHIYTGVASNYPDGYAKNDDFSFLYEIDDDLSNWRRRFAVDPRLCDRKTGMFKNPQSITDKKVKIGCQIVDLQQALTLLYIGQNQTISSESIKKLFSINYEPLVDPQIVKLEARLKGLYQRFYSHD